MPLADAADQQLPAPIPRVRELLTRERSVELAGTSTPGATLEVTGSAQPASATVGADGQWQVIVEFNDDGTFPLALTAAKNLYQRSEPSTVVIRVDTTPPAPPTLEETWAPTDHTAPTFTGAAEPGTTVSVSTIDRPSEHAQTRAAADGSWSVAIPGLRPTDTGITATATDEAGNESAETASTALEFIPTIAAPQADSTVPAGPIALAVIGWASATVDISVDGHHVGTIDLDENGTATGALVARASDGSAQPLPAGAHTMTVAYTADGTVSTHIATTTFTIR